MKLVSISALLLTFFSFSIKPNADTVRNENLQGAWQLVVDNGFDVPRTSVLLIMDGYIFFSDYSVSDKKFEGSIGGVYTQEGDKITYTIEFNTYNADQVGNEVMVELGIKGDDLTWVKNIDGSEHISIYRRIDKGEGDLAGAWRITDRMRDGTMQAMRQGSRKTIKMITGTRFQWAAYDPATKRFSGTGGGTIELKDGKYTENIEFFSRNKDRVGARLTFDYKVEGIKWDHSGLSSSGNPIREIWTRQNQ